MEEKIIQTAQPYLSPKEFQIMAEVGLGISLPSASKY